MYERYPDFEYLTEFLEEDMERPSLFCEFVKLLSQKRMCKSVLKKSEMYQLTYFAPTDEYGKARKSDINEVLSKILDVFSDGVLECEGRFYTVTAYSGGAGESEGFIDLTVDRTEYTGAGEGYRQKEREGEKMKRIILKQGGEKHELT